MEFKSYIDVLKENQSINSTELFAVICYKNINPSDYEKRLSYKGDLYGREIEVQFVKYMRDIYKFDSMANIYPLNIDL